MNEFKANSIEWNLFRDYYELFKTYYPPQDSVEYWTNMTRAQDDFLKKYGVKMVTVQESDPIPLLAQRLAFTMADYLDDIARMKKYGRKINGI